MVFGGFPRPGLCRAGRPAALDKGLKTHGFGKYTERAGGFIQSAQGLALRSDHQQVTPLHILKVLIEDREGLAANLTRAAGGDPAGALKACEGKLSSLPRVDGSGAGQVYLAPETERVFEDAERVADKAGDSFVTVERLLLALVLAAGTPAAKVLAGAGGTAQGWNRAIEDVRKGRAAAGATAEDS